MQSLQCRVQAVSAAAHDQKMLSARQAMALFDIRAADRHRALKKRLHAIYERHKGRYGYQHITTTLRQAGEIIHHRAVQRLMQLQGLRSLARPN